MLTLFRYPMAFSFSPLIHQAFGAQNNLSITYTITEADPSKLSQAIFAFREHGGVGANVTMPLKEEAYRACLHLTQRATIAQSVNTLFWRNNELYGDNTDGVGFAKDVLENLKLVFKDKTVCILGAGGAARGVIPDIAKECPKHLIVCNRTLAKAEILSEHFGQYQIPLEAMSLNALNAFSQKNAIDWIINACPQTAPFEQLLAPSLVEGGYLYELSYSKDGVPSSLSTWSLRHGLVRAFDGVGMLVEQAAQSFLSWFPQATLDTKPVISMVRAQLQHVTAQ